MSLKCAPNEIIYKTQYDTPVVLYENASFSGVNLVSNIYKNGIGRLTFDADLKEIVGAFYNCKSLTNVILPEGLIRLLDYDYKGVFENCSSLTSITIPNTVTKIGYSAFSSCNALSKVYCKPLTPPVLYGYPFSDNVLIYVPQASISAYRKDDEWSRLNTVGYDFQ